MAGNGYSSGVNFGILQPISAMDPHKTEMANIPLPDYKSEAQLRAAQAQNLYQESLNSALSAPLTRNLLAAQGQRAQVNAQMAQQEEPYKLQQMKLSNQLMNQMMGQNSTTGGSSNVAPTGGMMYPNGQGGYVPVMSFGPKGPSVRSMPNPNITPEQKNAQAVANANNAVNSLAQKIQQAGGISKADPALVKQYQDAVTYRNSLEQQTLRGATPEIQDTNAANNQQNTIPNPNQPAQTGPGSTAQVLQGAAISKATTPGEKALVETDNKQIQDYLSQQGGISNTIGLGTQMQQLANGLPNIGFGPLGGKISPTVSADMQKWTKQSFGFLMSSMSTYQGSKSMFRSALAVQAFMGSKPNASMFKPAAQYATQTIMDSDVAQSIMNWTKANNAMQEELKMGQITQDVYNNWAQQNPNPGQMYVGKYSVSGVNDYLPKNQQISEADAKKWGVPQNMMTNPYDTPQARQAVDAGEKILKQYEAQVPDGQMLVIDSNGQLGYTSANATDDQLKTLGVEKVE